MNPIIPAKECVQNAKWLPSEIQEYLIKYCVAVNRLSTPYPERELIDLLRKYAFQVRQFVVAYEVPPGFTRKGQYFTEPGYALYTDEDKTEIYTPGLYGLARDFDDSLKIVHFMREKIIEILRDHNHLHVTRAYNQFVRMRNMLTKEEQTGLNPLSLVSILPGRVVSWGVNKLGGEYQELVTMSGETNINSARFVKAALKRIIVEHNFTEEEVIILGSSGSLGHEITQFFPNARKYDTALKQKESIDFLLSKSALIIDCANGASLSEYFSRGFFLPGRKYIWVVESYPVPEEELVREIEASDYDITILHIKGVGTNEGGVLEHGYGNVIPFPVYGNIMPCCTGRVDQPSNHVITGELYDKVDLAKRDFSL